MLYRVTNLRGGTLISPDCGLSLKGHASAIVDDVTLGIRKAVLIGHAKVEPLEKEKAIPPPPECAESPPVTGLVTDYYEDVWSTSTPTESYGVQLPPPECADLPPGTALVISPHFDLSIATVKQILPIIEAETDLETLDKWRAKETRLVASKAIIRRISELKNSATD